MSRFGEEPVVTAVPRTLSGHLARCQECGSPKSSWLDGNCPTCLMRLGALSDSGEPDVVAPAASSVAPCLGGYELLQEIARGGMGVVYRARQVALNRQVAVKVLLGGWFADETFIKRFHREAEAAASLNHPNIVAIHEVGEEDGQVYYSMDLIEGRSLAELVADNPLPVNQAAQLIKTVAETVAFAHERGVLHRDLKPSNVLIDGYGVPHVTDFGLAKRSDVDGDLTMTGQIIGSPNYMAPEQADPKFGPTSEASDVYSLGAMLYHLLTGRPPFVAETVVQTLRFVTEGQVLPPSAFSRGIPRDLETICLKCLETDPALRYRATDLADELQRFLSHQPIQARPVGTMGKLARWCRRKPGLAASLASVAVLLLVVAIGSPIAMVRIYHEREKSEAARQQEARSRMRAEAGEREVQRQLYSALTEQANALVRSGEVGQRFKALEVVRRAAGISNSLELRRSALAALALPDLRFDRELPVESGITLRALDPDFRNIALCRGSGPVEIRSVSDWRLQSTLPASTNLPAYVGLWSADGRYLAVKRDCMPSGDLADLEVWEVSTRHRVFWLRNVLNRAMAFHPQQPLLITAQLGGDVSVWDLKKGQSVAAFRLGIAPTHLHFSPAGERFAAVLESADTSIVSVYDFTSGELKASRTFAQQVSALDWHPGGRWLAVADLGGMIQLMDSHTGQTHSLGSHKAQAVTVAFNPDGSFLWSGGWEGELMCWDTHTWQRSLTVGRQSWVVQFRADGRQCALHSNAGLELHTFSPPTPREFAEDLGPRLQHAAFSPDGRWLAASADRSLGVWDLTSSGPGALAQEDDEARLFFSADSTELFASTSSFACSRWRFAPGTNAAAPPLLAAAEISVPKGGASIALASNLVAFTSNKGSRTVTLQDLASTASTWLPTSPGINGLSPDRRWLGVFRPFSPLICMYSVPGIQPVATLTNQANVGDFVFNPQGDQLVVSSHSSIEFWSTNTWMRTRILTNFSALLFSRDPSTWWLTSGFRSAGLFDATSLKLLLPLPRATLPLALSPNGRFLAASVDLRHLQVWDLETVRHELHDLGLDWEANL